MKLAKIYVNGSLLLVNTLVIFVILNLGIYLVMSGYEFLNESVPVTEKYGQERLNLVYPHLDEDEIQVLLSETWSRPYVYEPFTQFREREYQGRYVNVSKDGFRHNGDDAPWPPEEDSINIFLFGGSTTFGYGVEDGQTIASHMQSQLQKALGRKVFVYNFGRGFYYSKQERILFEELLSSGYVPAAAVFLDGLNDFYHHDGRPLYTERFRRYVSGEVAEITLFSELPVTRLIYRLAGDKGESGSPDSAGNGVPYDDPGVLDDVIARYLANKKMIEAISSSYAVKPLFVWQPVPTYGYDLEHHLFAGTDFAGHTYSKYGYALFKEQLAVKGDDNNFVWAADMQLDMKEPLYVDQVHYTGKFSELIASVITERLAKGFF